MISFVPARNYLFKVSNLSTRVRCESCSILRMSMLTIFWRRSGVFNVNCEHILNFVLIVEFEEQTFAWFILKSQTLLNIRSGMPCVIIKYFKCE